ncbi:MAG: nucleoside triphosphate pyrophosphohydrolase [Candidatus Marinimicrobia bacterium]|jgi:tetrapyrrole methylase family protein/MazG family protein|nr:nucleoside triphosphate pyrophosphohydrolase [Candidatus Neomarinimicrobiota bacterium]MBT3502582.1 nucleoside triphosphate pyrophosphohydrolase [Candidatus Neomarinimicrobiota bacterium]MBT3839236.1 nucleoside triphosphate pyrophosphohydrolase [Candidatus Neomarinimicrobiota bacterium]MBT3999197.1 nucleoside triphosphate pyrophosphohydrolase [Candidatus Neomarinimicrobiota bacterium]MBT4281897.1 nucleoside triphosphate pyrophosphohydrolase [Candidatus Neomarinimicrobiota bacterium]
MKKQKIAEKFIKLLEIVETLRGPDGCPWDKEQTHASLLPYFLEEAYEVVESVDEENWDTVQEELGDIMLHVALQTQIASEDSKFTIADSLDTVNEKLVRRHPHVFGDKKTNEAFEAKQNWEETKHIEKNRKSRLDGVPPALPALIRAQRLQQKAAYAGFDWDNVDDVWAKLHEEIDELKSAHEAGDTENIKEEIGDVIFSMVNLSRYYNVPAEDMLRATNRKFIYRFQKIEEELEAKGKTLEESTLEEMDEIWERAKNK